MDTLSGAVERIALYNPQKGYTVLRLRASGVTLLITNHEPNVGFAVADDVLLMEPGTPSQFGTLIGLTQNGRKIAKYGTRKNIRPAYMGVLRKS